MTGSGIVSAQGLNTSTRLRVDAESGPIADELVRALRREYGVFTQAGPDKLSVWVDAAVLYRVAVAQAGEGRVSLPPAGITIYLARDYSDSGRKGWSELEKACTQ